MSDDKKPKVNPTVVLREEFDDWAILFDPDTNVTLGINPMGVYIWKCLDGKHTVMEGKRVLEASGKNFLGAVLNRRKYHIPSWIYRRL